MRYSKAMENALMSQEDEVRKLMTYYLNKYLDDLEEPEFKSTDLKRLWMQLLLCGLVETMRQNDKKSALALNQLKKLINCNAQWFENKALNKTEAVIKTIKTAEMQKEKRKAKDALS